jgi:hypothetical protein
MLITPYFFPCRPIESLSERVDINIQDPGFRFAPPWASDVYHAFGVLLRSELLKLA